MLRTARDTRPWGLHWFRRDLRVTGNPALQWNRQRHGGRVLGLFCFDSKFLGRKDFSHNRFAFFLDTLEALRTELRAAGGDLLVVDQLPHLAFPDLVKRAVNRGLPVPTVTFNRDYEPFARGRDQRIQKLLETDLGVSVHTERDHLISEPHEVTRMGQAYKVYTPYSRRWFEAFRTPEIQKRFLLLPSGRFCLTWKTALGRDVPDDACPEFHRKNSKSVTVPIPQAGHPAALEQLQAFRARMEDYARYRDFPAVDGTSGLSVFFKNGSLTPAQAVSALGLQTSRTPTVFLKELIWREFFYSILWHYPHVEHEAFQEKYRDIEWENDPALFRAWKNGETGYPIVDAGMRQLLTTGRMHNRVRMIVASFLTKDLLIDWRWGERHFMEQLLDGDLAANNGGWQWAASTGCDAQPYFRIFNPELQSRKFNPSGAYIRTWVPELRPLSDKAIHAPPKTRGYPAPIVNHAARKMAALRLYK